MTGRFDRWDDSIPANACKHWRVGKGSWKDCQLIFTTDVTTLSARALGAVSTNTWRCWWVRECRWDCSLRVLERRKRFFAPRLMEKVLTNRKHGLDHAIRFWITHDYVINCSWKSLRFCSFGRNIAFTKLVVSHKRRQMQRVFIWTFFIVVRHTISPPNESHMSCYILHMDFLKHSTHIIGAIFTKSTIPEIFYAKQWDTCNIYSKYSLYLFSYYCICMYFWKF